MMKAIDYILILALATTVLVGCSAAPEAQTESIAPSGEQTSVSSGARGLDPINRLALGTLELEGTEHALTAAQAADLLPLWKMIQGGSLQGDTETNAVIKQIEGKMSAEQLAAIDGLELTYEDIRAWMEAQGIEMPAPASGQGGPGALGDLSEEERAKMREEFQNMSAEERATRMAEMGIERPGGQGQGGGTSVRPGGGAGGQSSALLGPLVELLTERAAG
jgi:hypothetical protein